MKYILSKIFILILLFLGCENTNIKNQEKELEETNMEVILYGTKEFDEFINKKPNISLERAWEIHQKYLNKNLNEDINDINFIIDDYYVFSNFIEYKLMEASVEGIWIHSQTGEIKKVSNSKKISLYEQGGWNYRKSKK
ncbi:MAG: hypothetical protein GY932_05610 [Arcobacter sp.]|nr:hypothetical protein [Arcobacter sp.]